MARLVVFESISIDGYFTDRNNDFSWAHDAGDEEYNAFVASNAKGGGVLVFGRVTYQLMAGYWPTPMAAENDPVVAAQMNALPKIVFSKTLPSASWSNTTLLKDDLEGEIRKRKQGSGPDMVILGSGSLVSQLAQARLIDEYQFVLVPVVLGDGRPLFPGVNPKQPLALASSRTFKNGRIFLSYRAG